MVYIVCNFYPEFYTLIPAGVIAGCAAGTLWSAKAQYITVSALEYAKLTNRNKDAVIGIDENALTVTLRGGSVLPRHFIMAFSMLKVKADMIYVFSCPKIQFVV